MDKTELLIINLLTFCRFEEFSKMVTDEGELTYMEGGDANTLRSSYKITSTGIAVCEIALTWYVLQPEYSLDHCAYLITRLHVEINERQERAKSEKEKQIYQDLHNSILSIYNTFNTLQPGRILSGLNAFMQHARRLIAQLRDT